MPKYQNAILLQYHFLMKSIFQSINHDFFLSINLSIMIVFMNKLFQDVVLSLRHDVMTSLFNYKSIS